MRPVILKIRSLGEDLPIPAPVEKDGVRCVTLDMIGELVCVPAPMVDRCERIVGTVSLTSPLPCGVEIALDPPNDELNGFWVQRAIYDAVKAEGNYSSEPTEFEAIAEGTGEPVPEATAEELEALRAAVELDTKAKSA